MKTFFMSHRNRESASPTPSQFARGVTLVEVMVAIVVLSIGFLGIAGLQATTIKYKINTWAHSSATSLFSELSERIRVNPDVAGTSFATGGVSAASEYAINDTWATQQAQSLSRPIFNCDGSIAACTPSQRADHDLRIWRQQVRDRLPQGAALISGNRSDGLTVTMMWFDKEQLRRVTASAAQETLTLALAPVCPNTDTQANTGTQMAQRSCCPPAAAAPAGVRCINFSFVP